MFKDLFEDGLGIVIEGKGYNNSTLKAAISKAIESANIVDVKGDFGQALSKTFNPKIEGYGTFTLSINEKKLIDAVKKVIGKNHPDKNIKYSKGKLTISDIDMTDLL